MKLKIIKQLDESVSFEFYNSKGEKLEYEIAHVEKDGIGFTYTLKGLYVVPRKKKVNEDEI